MARCADGAIMRSSPAIRYQDVGLFHVTGQALSGSLIPVAKQLYVRVSEEATKQCRWGVAVIIERSQQVRICHYDELS
jgi:hypothetical protein